MTTKNDVFIGRCSKSDAAELDRIQHVIQIDPGVDVNTRNDVNLGRVFNSPGSPYDGSQVVIPVDESGIPTGGDVAEFDIDGYADAGALADSNLLVLSQSGTELKEDLATVRQYMAKSLSAYQSLSGNLELFATDARWQYLDPGAAARDVTLDTTLEVTGTTVHIFNVSATSGRNLVVKNNGGSTQATIYAKAWMCFTWTGAAWVFHGAPGVSSIGHFGLALAPDPSYTLAVAGNGILTGQFTAGDISQIGIGSPRSAAILDLVVDAGSAPKSLGLPSMSAGQRDGITTPRAGDIVFTNTGVGATDNIAYYASDGDWYELIGVATP